MLSEKAYSEEVAAKIDAEIEGFIDRAYKKAYKIVNSNKKALKAIADELMKKEVLEHDEFYKIVKPFKLKPVAAQDTIGSEKIIKAQIFISFERVNWKALPP